MGWIGVDLDGCLARYDEWIDETHIGEPIPIMVRRVKIMLKRGMDVRIFTARASIPRAKQYIEKWCQEHIGEILPITNVKDFEMIVLFDDRCIQVEPNTGKLIQ